MARRGKPQEVTETWFLKDRAIESAAQDRLDHKSVAQTLVEAIRSAEPPCMIGLLAEFGKGKSSTTNIAAAMLNESGTFDTVTVSADKHAGTERARNLVHGVAGALLRYDKIDEGDVEDILRPLRQATQVAAKDPTDTPARRLESGRYNVKGLLSSMKWFAAAALGAGVAALLAGADAGNLLTIVAASPLVVWLALMTFAGKDTPGGSLLEPAVLTDHKPRAEAADEIEEVFGRLIDYHRKHRGRRLVVFVDDIDRLATDDVPDALRALRSLQSVPRGNEPIFVIACNEEILRSAVGSSAAAPATAARTEHTAEIDVEESEQASADDDAEPHAMDVDLDRPRWTRELGERPGDSDHDHPALAFIDKLLTVRIPMPPTMRGDMRNFAHDVIQDDHPLRKADDVHVDQIIGILIHDTVDEPRSVIRLLNRFIAAYLLGHRREEAGRVYPTDITHHTDVLAQLCVLADEFPDFHREITQNTILLAAASKVALRSTNLTNGERAALEESAALEGSAAGTTYRFVQPALRRYLSSTARRVSLPDDIGPIVYFATTPGGRLLGAALRTRLMSAIRSGDHEEVADVLADVPSDRRPAAASEIAQVLKDAAAVDAETYVAAIAPNLPGLGDDAADVADAAAALVDQAAGDLFDPNNLATLAEHTDVGRHDLLCSRLVTRCGNAEETNERLLVAARHLTSHRPDRVRLEPDVVSWLDNLAEQGGWPLAKPWLNVAENFDPEDHADLLRSATMAIAASVGSEKTITAEEADRLIALAHQSLSGHAQAAPSSSRLADKGPITSTLFLKLWEITGATRPDEDALFAATAAADAELEPLVRCLAVQLVTKWVDGWKDSTRTPTEEGAEPTSLVPEFLELLTDALRVDDVRPAFHGALPALGEKLGDRVLPLLNVASDRVAELSPNDSPAAGELARTVVEAAAHDPQMLSGQTAKLLASLNTDADPGAPAVQVSLQVLAQILAKSAGAEAVAPLADAWANRIQKAGAHDDRTRIQAFHVLRSIVPDMVDQRAEGVLTQCEAHISTPDEPAQRIRVIATFPWPDTLVDRALVVLDGHWDTVADAERVSVFRLVTRASDEHPALASYHDRMVSAVEHDPYGEAAATAATEIPRLGLSRASRIYAAAVGRHQAVTDSWINADGDLIGSTIAERAKDDSDAGRLLDALPIARKSEAAAESLIRIVATSDVPAPVVERVAGDAHEDQLPSVIAQALDGIGEDMTTTASSLRVLDAIRPRSNFDLAVIDTKAADLMPDATQAVAGLFGRLLRGHRNSKPLDEVLKELRSEEDPRASAFDNP